MCAWWWHSDFVISGVRGRYGGVSILLCWVLTGTQPEGNILGWTSYLPSDGVWTADHSSLQDSWVLGKGTFHFNRPNTVAGREKQILLSNLPAPPSFKERRKEQTAWPWGIDHIVISSHEPKVAILVLVGSVPCDVKVPSFWCLCLLRIVLEDKRSPWRAISAQPLKPAMALAAPYRRPGTPNRKSTSSQRPSWPEFHTGQGAMKCVHFLSFRWKCQEMIKDSPSLPFLEGSKET